MENVIDNSEIDDDRQIDCERLRKMSIPELNVLCNTLITLREPDGKYSFKILCLINAIKYVVWYKFTIKKD